MSAKAKKPVVDDAGQNDDETFKEMEASLNGLRVALNMQVTLVHDLNKNLKSLRKKYEALKGQA